MEDLDIKYAIDFINKMGYSWDGKVGRTKPKTIVNFSIPQIIKLNGVKKGLILYDEQTDKPECRIYWFEKHGNCYNFVTEKDLTKEWIEYLKGI